MYEDMDGVQVKEMVTTMEIGEVLEIIIALNKAGDAI